MNLKLHGHRNAVIAFAIGHALCGHPEVEDRGGIDHNARSSTTFLTVSRDEGEGRVRRSLRDGILEPLENRELFRACEFRCDQVFKPETPCTGNMEFDLVMRSLHGERSAGRFSRAVTDHDVVETLRQSHRDLHDIRCLVVS